VPKQFLDALGSNRIFLTSFRRLVISLAALRAGAKTACEDSSALPLKLLRAQANMMAPQWKQQEIALC
jgi:hypothetical protein